MLTSFSEHYTSSFPDIHAREVAQLLANTAIRNILSDLFNV